MKKIVKILVAILFILVTSLLIAYPLMELWNAVIPDVFGLGKITYWQSVALFLVAKILFTKTE